MPEKDGAQRPVVFKDGIFTDPANPSTVIDPTSVTRKIVIPKEMLVENPAQTVLFAYTKADESAAKLSDKPLHYSTADAVYPKQRAETLSANAALYLGSETMSSQEQQSQERALMKHCDQLKADLKPLHEEFQE